MSEQRKICESCNLALGQGAIHFDQGSCIQALQAAMLAQRRAAEELGQVISSRLLVILEEMSRELGDTGAMGKLMLERYREMGDWNVLNDLREKLKSEEGVSLMLEGIIRAVYDYHKDDLGQRLREEMRSIIRDLESRHERRRQVDHSGG